jgi:hypothetical protein
MKKLSVAISVILTVIFVVVLVGCAVAPAVAVAPASAPVSAKHVGNFVSLGNPEGYNVEVFKFETSRNDIGGVYTCIMAIGPTTLELVCP